MAAPIDAILDFKAVKEEWTDYELEDGSVIRLKVLLSYLEEEGEKSHAMNVHHVMAIWTPPDKRKPDAGQAPLPVEELRNHVVEEGVKCDLRTQGQSIYRTSQGVVTLEIRATRFHRTDKYDVQGMPQYIVEQEIRTTAQAKPKVAGQRQRKKKTKPRSD